MATVSLVTVRSLAHLAEVAMGIEKLRIQCQVRLAHLEKNREIDPDTEVVLSLILPNEREIDRMLGVRVMEHPAYGWFSRIRGIGRGTEGIGKFLGRIEAFGRYYDICSICGEQVYVSLRQEVWDEIRGRDKITRVMLEDVPIAQHCGQVCRRLYVSGPERLPSVSKLWKHEGLIGGVRRKRGKLNDADDELRTVLHRVVSSLLRVVNPPSKFRTHPLVGYEAYKRRLLERNAREGIKVVSARELPYQVNTEGRRVRHEVLPYELDELGHRVPKSTDGMEPMISLGHVDAMAKRHTAKVFSGMLLVVWRDALGLQTRPLYVSDQLNHPHVVDPWEMCDYA